MDYSNINLPNHIAIIMDGNGRWATERSLRRSDGHLEGSKTLEKIAFYAYERGIKILSVFAFSIDNFKRSDEEVNYLMNLFVKMFNNRFNKFNNKNVKIVFSGSRNNLTAKVLDAMDKITSKTSNNTGCFLNICLNYGGQDEIIDACKKIGSDLLDKNINIDDINKELIKSYLYQNLPDIDLVIRTSGEQRISNFMLWQLAYAELYFSKTYFPALTTDDFDIAILEFNKRNRRFGEIKYETKSN